MKQASASSANWKVALSGASYTDPSGSQMPFHNSRELYAIRSAITKIWSVSATPIWGPQVASHPMGRPCCTLTVDEHCYLQDAFIIWIGGTIACWKEIREKHVSQATCKAKIKSLNECTHLVQALQLVLEDLNMSNINKPTLIYNDNQAFIYWSKGWANQCMCRLISKTWQSEMHVSTRKSILSISKVSWILQTYLSKHR
jgi:hypothetical protein